MPTLVPLSPRSREEPTQGSCSSLSSNFWVDGRLEQAKQTAGNDRLCFKLRTVLLQTHLSFGHPQLHARRHGRHSMLSQLAASILQLTTHRHWTSLTAQTLQLGGQKPAPAVFRSWLINADRLGESKGQYEPTLLDLKGAVVQRRENSF
ncbi:hypothetical protein [Pseudorhodoferax sp. Leaf265]|uniref:hypothetical protein n=1 Tax=Pseudorhodoferax sp. Leaf265 TaxID=1736315 RepID=UPI0012E7F013|nr:hypothetical protein [Pseudorhodoferax sp. Leaf265]